MRQHSGADEQKWNRQFTIPIFPAGAKNAVWKRDYYNFFLLHEGKYMQYIWLSCMLDAKLVCKAGMKFPLISLVGDLDEVQSCL